MAHVGKAWPGIQNRDLHLWTGSSRQYIARRCKAEVRIVPSASSDCLFTRVHLTSEPFEVFYEDVLGHYRFNHPCPGGWHFFLEWMRKPAVDDFGWRCSLWNNTGLINRTVYKNNFGLPAPPGNFATIDWTFPIPPGKFVQFFGPGIQPVGWPP
jgi:hypothetical protein